MVAAVLPANAATGTVFCPGDLSGPALDRQIKVTNAEDLGVNSYCLYTSGNWDNQPGWPYTFSIIDKDEYGAGKDGGLAEGQLDLDVTATNFGTWSVTGNLDAYARIFLGFHFGNGGGDPDSFIVELNRAFNPLTGEWFFLRETGGYANQEISNAYLLGVRDGVNPPNDVPVPIPAAAWLLGSGLLAMGAIGRRRMKGHA